MAIRLLSFVSNYAVANFMLIVPYHSDLDQSDRFNRSIPCPVSRGER